MQCEECSPHIFCSKKGCTQGNCTECADNDDDDEWAVKLCYACDSSVCPEHFLSELTVGACEGCDERALPLIMKKRNASLDELNELKKVLGHTDKFVTDDDDDISKLVEEQKKLQSHFDELYSSATPDEKKKFDERNHVWV